LFENAKGGGIVLQDAGGQIGIGQLGDVSSHVGSISISNSGISGLTISDGGAHGAGGITITESGNGGITIFNTGTGNFTIWTQPNSLPGAYLVLENLPTSNPGGSKRVWNNAGVLSIT
jgi:hypothetical protein